MLIAFAIDFLVFPARERMHTGRQNVLALSLSAQAYHFSHAGDTRHHLIGVWQIGVCSSTTARCSSQLELPFWSGNSRTPRSKSCATNSKLSLIYDLQFLPRTQGDNVVHEMARLGTTTHHLDLRKTCDMPTLSPSKLTNFKVKLAIV